MSPRPGRRDPAGGRFARLYAGVIVVEVVVVFTLWLVGRYFGA
jgi:hypothetical protein